MTKPAILNRAVALMVAFSLCAALTRAIAPQGLPGGASALQGQDIIGGAAIVFKKPQPSRDLVGGAAMLMVKRQVRRRPSVVARNTGSDPGRETRPTGPGA